MLINSTTDLNKLKFTSSGGDRWDQGKSGQPYIIKSIPGADDTFLQQLDGQPLPKSGVDFLLRGGLLSAEAAGTDVSRLSKMLFDTRSPNGFEFIAKQNVLSRQNVKTEASFGTGYGFGALNQGLFSPTSTLGQAGVVPIAPGSFNSFGVNPRTDINPLTGDLGDNKSNNGGINSYFSTVNIQNIIQDGSWSDNNRLVLLNQGISFGTEEKTIGGNITLNPDNAGVNILNYGGGPGSVLLFGKTNIRFADQRTGLKNAKLPIGVDGGPSFINPTGPNRYDIFGKFYNPTIEASITGVTDVTNDPSSIIKSNIFHKGATNSFLNAAGTGDSVETKFDLEVGYSLDLEQINDYASQPVGGLRTFLPNVYQGGSGSLLSTTSNEYITWNYGAELLDQQQLYTASINNYGDRQKLNPSDFRSVKRANDKFTVVNSSQTTGQGNSPVSSILSLAPNYITQNANIVFNQGDPGKGNPTVTRNGAIATGPKNVWNYAFNPSGKMAKTALDKINALAMYESSSVDTISSTNDSCQFNIAVINNKDQGATNTYLHFRAFLDSFSDSYGADWKDVQYVGRAEKLYNYAGFKRDISMDFTVYAQSKAELIPMYKKLNYLASTLAPDYSPAGYMRGNMVKMTVGGYLYDQPGIIRSLNYTVPMESTWEIAINTDGGKDPSVKQLPHMIKVTGLQFTPIHKFVPSRAGNLLDPVEKYIALANNNSTNNYQDLYENNFAALQKIKDEEDEAAIAEKKAGERRVSAPRT
jgi:hypothetical protein|tara:strand:+ start:2866 stop:5127 length:2262 start_codon:yes stop_codon:yes gene_type:complete